MSSDTFIEDQMSAYCTWLEQTNATEMSPTTLRTTTSTNSAEPPSLIQPQPSRETVADVRISRTVHRWRSVLIGCAAVALIVLTVVVVATRRDSTNDTIGHTPATADTGVAASTNATGTTTRSEASTTTIAPDSIQVDPSDLQNHIGELHIPSGDRTIEIATLNNGDQVDLAITGSRVCPRFSQLSGASPGCTLSLDEFHTFVRILQSDAGSPAKTFEIVLLAPAGVDFQLLDPDGTVACPLASTSDPDLRNAVVWTCSGSVGTQPWTLEAATSIETFRSSVPVREVAPQPPYKVGDVIEDPDPLPTWLSIALSASGVVTGDGSCGELAPVVRDRTIIGFTPQGQSTCSGSGVIYGDDGAVIGLIEPDGPVLLTDVRGRERLWAPPASTVDALPPITFIDGDFDINLDTYATGELVVDKKSSLIPGFAQVCVRLTNPDGGSGASCADSKEFRLVSSWTSSADDRTQTATFAAATGTAIEIIDGTQSGCDLRRYAPTEIGNMVVWACDVPTGTSLPVRITPPNGLPVAFIMTVAGFTLPRDLVTARRDIETDTPDLTPANCGKDEYLDVTIDQPIVADDPDAALSGFLATPPASNVPQHGFEQMHIVDNDTYRYERRNQQGALVTVVFVLRVDTGWAATRWQVSPC